MSGKWRRSDELYEGFRGEATDRLAELSSALLAFEGEAAGPDVLEAIRRHAHSIKGSARLLGFIPISELAHEMENLLAGMKAGQRQATPELVDLLLAACDDLGVLVDAGNPEHDDASRAMLDRIRGRMQDLPDEAADTGTAGVDAAEFSPPPPAAGGPTVLRIGAAGPDRPRDVTPVEYLPSGLDDVAPARRDQELEPATSDGVVRLETAKVHGLINAVGEVSTGQIGMGERYRRLKALSARVNSEVRRLGGQARSESIGGEPVLGEFLVDVAEELASLTTDVGEVIDESERRLASLQEQAMDLAMFPAQTIFGPLPRLVRDLCRSLGKEADLVVDDGGAKLDKRILERIAEPIRALIINAVDHGVESPAERIAAGKNGRATIRLQATQRGGQVVFEVADDGRGIDLDSVRARAIEGGIVHANDDVDAAELARLLFRSGFSTRDHVSDLSGRGVGLDVVHSAIEALQGTVEAETVAAGGTRFTLTVPITLSIVAAIIVRVGTQRVAFPVSAVEEIATISGADVVSLGGRRAIEVRGRIMPLLSLAGLLGFPAGGGQTDGDSAAGPVVILSQTARTAAFSAEAIVGQQEVVVKTLGTFVPRVKHVSGASILGDGSVVLVLDPSALLETVRRGTQSSEPVSPATESPAEAASVRILVVDDSFPVREMERMLLESAGFDVTTAQDGGEALELARITRFDGVVTDIAMPNMDGFDLCATLRSEFPDVPVIMVTSLSSESDRRRGLEIGANAYLTKAEFDEGVLVSTLRSLVGV